MRLKTSPPLTLPSVVPQVQSANKAKRALHTPIICADTHGAKLTSASTGSRNLEQAYLPLARE